MLPPRISVVIPCFNLGGYAAEAVDSVLAQTFQDFEIVIVNDGSTDPTTQPQLDAIASRDARIRVLHSVNRGLAGARNLGIESAAGQYILPLDADDRIAPTFLEKAAAVLDRRPEIGIVYSEVEWFGERSGKWDVSPYRFPEILVHNSIVATALFRRADWERAGGYCTEFRSRWEDYDFWLSLIERGCHPHRIPEILFFYRQRSGSMSDNPNPSQFADLYELLFRRHPELYAKNIRYIFQKIVSLEHELESLRNPPPVVMQVFRPTPDGYQDSASSVAAVVSGDWRDLEIAVPPFAGCLRFDPSNLAAVIEIESLRVVAPDGEELWSQAGPLPATVGGTAHGIQGAHILRMIAWGDDPQLLLPPINAAKGACLVARFRVLPFGREQAAGIQLFASLHDRLHTCGDPFEAVLPPAAVAQVFLPENGAYRGEQSVQTGVTTGQWTRVELRLPGGWRGRLRFDPANCRCAIEIRSLEVRGEQGVVWDAGRGSGIEVAGTAVAPSAGNPLQFIAWDADPQILLPTDGVEAESELVLSAELRISPCDTGLAMRAETLSLSRRGIDW